MTLRLVCEGECNPMLADIDRDVRTFRKENPPVDEKMVSVPSHLAEGLHLLKHTEHQDFGRAFACVSCGGVRIYGWDW